MADSAVHLGERVLPAVPVRHWICSLSWGLRALLGYDRELCAKVVRAFVGELCRSLAHRAKRELGHSSIADAHPGAVCAVQRTDGALRLNVHLHVLALDGVYVRDTESQKLEFHELETPTRAEVEEVARRTAERIEKVLRKAGRSLDPEMQSEAPPPELALDEPGLASCYAAAPPRVPGRPRYLPRCSGPMRWFSAAKTPEAARELLARLGLAARPPPLRMPPPLGQLELPLGR
jgi:hypothetical protein